MSKTLQPITDGVSTLAGEMEVAIREFRAACAIGNERGITGAMMMLKDVTTDMRTLVDAGILLHKIVEK